MYIHNNSLAMFNFRNVQLAEGPWWVENTIVHWYIALHDRTVLLTYLIDVCTNCQCSYSWHVWWFTSCKCHV